MTVQPMGGMQATATAMPQQQQPMMGKYTRRCCWLVIDGRFVLRDCLCGATATATALPVQQQATAVAMPMQPAPIAMPAAAAAWGEKPAVASAPPGL